MFVDRSQINDSMSEVVEAVVAQVDTFPDVSIPEQVKRLVVGWAEDGDEWAQSVCESRLLMGFKHDVDSFSRRITSKIVDERGNSEDFPMIVDAHVIREDGTIEHGKAPWETLDLTRYERFTNRLEKTGRTMLRHAGYHKRVLSLWKKVPRAKNAGEACRLSGQDPRQLRFDDTKDKAS